jgi:hypothetical protein
MKIRTGFVSNSSSSSFIARGVKLKIEDLATRLGVNKNESDLFDKLYNKVGYNKLRICSTAYYFDYNATPDKEDVIIGVIIASPDDGVVSEIKDPDDVKVRKQIEAKIGKVGPLKTYIQLISNDNF